MLKALFKYSTSVSTYFLFPLFSPFCFLLILLLSSTLSVYSSTILQHPANLNRLFVLSPGKNSTPPLNDFLMISTYLFSSSSYFFILFCTLVISIERIQTDAQQKKKTKKWDTNTHAYLVHALNYFVQWRIFFNYLCDTICRRTKWIKYQPRQFT